MPSASTRERTAGFLQGERHDPRAGPMSASHMAMVLAHSRAEGVTRLVALALDRFAPCQVEAGQVGQAALDHPHEAVGGVDVARVGGAEPRALARPLSAGRSILSSIWRHHPGGIHRMQNLVGECPGP